MSLFGVNPPGTTGGKRQPSGDKIPHKRILSMVQDANAGGRNVVEIYRGEVLPIKTRTIRLLGRKCPARIINTLLGFEVQASCKRIDCPDLVTARYLKVFTELGCRSIKLPYDPTVTDRLIPELELAMSRMSAGVRRLFPAERSLQLYVLRRIYAHIRSMLHSH